MGANISATLLPQSLHTFCGLPGRPILKEISPPLSMILTDPFGDKCTAKGRYDCDLYAENGITIALGFVACHSNGLELFQGKSPAVAWCIDSAIIIQEMASRKVPPSC